jgi:NlpC/P60 family
MPQLEFVTEFARIAGGDDEGPDPFADIEGPLDSWMDTEWDNKAYRPRPWSRQIIVAPDDGDPAHVRADKRAQERGVDPAAPGNNLLTIARSQIGADYDWADANPANTGFLGSFDCSGYTQWVLSRFGIQTEHLAEAQQQQFRSLKRNELRPGDLIFYNYGRKAAGVADHVAIYIGGGRQIAASSSADQVLEQGVDWGNFIGGGATGIAAKGPKGRSGREPRRGAPSIEETGPPTMAPTFFMEDLADDKPAFGAVLASLLQSPTARLSRPGAGRPPTSSAAIKRQLYNGFMDAGRPDLAKMVNTDDFSTWIAAESGHSNWATNPEAVSVASQSFPGHGRNYGLFQFWEGHDWTNRYLNGATTWTADAYTQAKLAARYFPHLGPDDIRRYAAQIRNGNYSGWG